MVVRKALAWGEGSVLLTLNISLTSYDIIGICLLIKRIEGKGKLTKVRKWFLRIKIETQVDNISNR